MLLILRVDFNTYDDKKVLFQIENEEAFRVAI